MPNQMLGVSSVRGKPSVEFGHFCVAPRGINYLPMPWKELALETRGSEQLFQWKKQLGLNPSLLAGLPFLP